MPPVRLFLLSYAVTVSRLCIPFVLAGSRYALRHDDDGMTSSPIYAYLLSPAIDSLLSYLAGSRYALCYPDYLSRRFSLRPVFYPVRLLSITYPTGRYFCLLRLRTLRLFVLVSSVLVYILGWRWDDPHLQSTLQPP